MTKKGKLISEIKSNSVIIRVYEYKDYFGQKCYYSTINLLKYN